MKKKTKLEKTQDANELLCTFEMNTYACMQRCKGYDSTKKKNVKGIPKIILIRRQVLYSNFDHMKKLFEMESFIFEILFD